MIFTSLWLSRSNLWMKKSLKLIPWIPVIRMILPLYAGWLDCCCKVQVKSYMYSNIGRNPNVLWMLTSFKFACKLKFGYRLVSCELCVCFSLVWSIGACNAFLLFPTTHLHGGGICSNIVWSNEGTGILRKQGSVCEGIYFLKWVLQY